MLSGHGMQANDAERIYCLTIFESRSLTVGMASDALAWLVAVDFQRNSTQPKPKVPNSLILILFEF